MKDQILTTNVWLEHVSLRSRFYRESIANRIHLPRNGRITSFSGIRQSTEVSPNSTYQASTYGFPTLSSTISTQQRAYFFLLNLIKPFFPLRDAITIEIGKFQRGRGVRSHHDDQSYPTLHGEGTMDTSSYLQILVRDRRSIFPVRSTNLLHEVRFVDLRRYSGKKRNFFRCYIRSTRP